MKIIRDFEVSGKRVLVRCDFNVPINDKGEILDDFRIKQTIPTIEYLVKKEAKVILISHLGRPEGKVVEGMRLTPVAARLSELLGRTVMKLDDCLGREVKEAVGNMQPGQIILLENIQFNPGENSNDPVFAKILASYADFFIMEAFGQAHRNYASIAGINQFIPSAAGFLLEKEVDCLTRLGNKPEKPLVAIIGGKKVEDKIKAIDKISEVADLVIVSGLIKKEIDDKNIKLKYPEKIIWPIDEIGEGKDVGPKTNELFRNKILGSKTIFWNGPLGRIEEDEFLKGSEALAGAIIKSGAFSIVGGGETVEFINKLGLIDKFSHVSTGGGAMLEFLSGEELPGIKALE